jgi:hypothetical protein
VGLAGGGRRSEREHSEIRLKRRVGRRRRGSVDVHRKSKGARRRRNDIEYRGSGNGLSHGHFEGLDEGERRGWRGWTGEYSHCAGVSRVRMAGMIVSLFFARA